MTGEACNLRCDLLSGQTGMASHRNIDGLATVELQIDIDAQKLQTEYLCKFVSRIPPSRKTGPLH
jgi:hypothetical protein